MQLGEVVAIPRLDSLDRGVLGGSGASRTALTPRSDAAISPSRDAGHTSRASANECGLACRARVLGQRLGRGQRRRGKRRRVVDQPIEQRVPCIVVVHGRGIFAEALSSRIPRRPMRFEAACPTLHPSSRRLPASDQPRRERLGRAVPAAGRDLPRRALRAEPRRPARADRRHARRAHPVRGRPHLRGRRGEARAARRARPRRVGGRGHERDVLVRRGHHRLGGRPSRGGAREPGAPRSARALRSRHADRARGADRRAARSRAASSRARSTSTASARTRRSRTRSSCSRSASATRRRSPSTTRTSAHGSSTRPRPTR